MRQKNLFFGITPKHWARVLFQKQAGSKRLKNCKFDLFASENMFSGNKTLVQHLGASPKILFLPDFFFLFYMFFMRKT